MAPAEFATEAWVHESGALIDLGTSFAALVQVTVTGAPGGEERYYRRYDGGRVVASGSGPVKGADVTLTLPVDEARAVLAGQLDLSVAFMQGRLKTAGDNGLLLAYLSAWSSSAGAVCIDHLRAALGDG